MNLGAELLCIFSLYRALSIHSIKSSPKAIRKIRKFSKQNAWFLIQNDGKILQTTLLGHSLITRYFMLLNFSVQDRYLPLSVVLFYDAVTFDDWQTLRIYCRFLPASFWKDD